MFKCIFLDLIMKHYWTLYCLITILLFCTTVHCQCLHNEECIVVKACPPLFKLLIKNPLSAQDVQRLQSSQCGYDLNLTQPKVCCPKAIQKLPESKLLLDEKDCGTDLHSDAIYRGHNTTLGEFPWLALLEYQTYTTNRTEFRCAGTLISNRHVLTSANCVSRLPLEWKLIHVRLGEHQLDTDPDCENLYNFQECADPMVNVPVESIIVHPQYNPNDQTNNIAIIRLNKSVSYTEWILPICLPKYLEFESQKATNVFMTVSGFGTLDKRSKNNAKNKLSVLITSDDTCTPYFKDLNVITTDTQICASGRKYKNFCINDNGGPLMTARSTNQGNKWYIYGIMSFGELQCNSEFLGTYTIVIKYMRWILDNLKP